MGKYFGGGEGAKVGGSMGSQEASCSRGRVRKNKKSGRGPGETLESPAGPMWGFLVCAEH